MTSRGEIVTALQLSTCKLAFPNIIPSEPKVSIAAETTTADLLDQIQNTLGLLRDDAVRHMAMLAQVSGHQVGAAIGERSA